MYAPLAAGSFWICVAVASVALVITYEPGVAVPPAIVEAATAAVLVEVGVVAVKLAGSLTAWNVSWNFESRSWILSSSVCWLLSAVTLFCSGVSCCKVSVVYFVMIEL